MDDKWTDEYYEQKEQKNMDLVKCWTWAAAISLGLAVWVLAIKGFCCWLYH